MMIAQPNRNSRPTRPTMLFTVEAQQLLNVGRVRQAIEVCKRGLVYFPAHVTGYLVLAQAYHDLGQRERAVNVLRDGYRRTGAVQLERLRALFAGETTAEEMIGGIEATHVEVALDTAMAPAAGGVPDAVVTEDVAPSSEARVEIAEIGTGATDDAGVDDSVEAADAGQTVEVRTSDAPEADARATAGAFMRSGEPAVAEAPRTIDHAAAIPATSVPGIDGVHVTTGSSFDDDVDAGETVTDGTSEAIALHAITQEKAGDVESEHSGVQMEPVSPAGDDAVSVPDAAAEINETPGDRPGTIDPPPSEPPAGDPPPAVPPVSEPPSGPPAIEPPAELPSGAPAIEPPAETPASQPPVVEPSAEASGAEVVAGQNDMPESEPRLEDVHVPEVAADAPVTEVSGTADDVAGIDASADSDEGVTADDVSAEVLKDAGRSVIEEPGRQSEAAAAEARAIADQQAAAAEHSSQEVPADAGRTSSEELPAAAEPTPVEPIASDEQPVAAEADTSVPKPDSGEQIVAERSVVEERKPAPSRPALAIVGGREHGQMREPRRSHAAPGALIGSEATLERERSLSLALHTGRHVSSRLRSSNLRLIPGLEFAPLRQEEQVRRQPIAPLINEPMPELTRRSRNERTHVTETIPLPVEPAAMAPTPIPLATVAPAPLATVEAPMSVESPAVAEAAVVPESPTVVEAPAMIESPTVESPAVVEAPAMVESPAVVEAPVAIEPPTAVEAPVVEPAAAPPVTERPAAEIPATETAELPAAERPATTRRREPVTLVQEIARRHPEVAPERPASGRPTSGSTEEKRFEGLTPLEELARRLEKARIPVVEEPSARDASRKGFESTIVSETLADILLSQGAHQEALKAFRTLARTRADRSAYFQEKIRRIEEMIAAQGDSQAG